MSISAKDMQALGFEHFRLLPTGEWAGVRAFLFTHGLLVGIDEELYRTRFCYSTQIEARVALEMWDGTGAPPGRWIKEKGRAGERQNPRYFKGIAIAVEEPHRSADL